ncbi:MAG: PorP/SprF family type IX secretion system membrane protein [Marinifilaceae bacterium]
MKKQILMLLLMLGTGSVFAQNMPLINYEQAPLQFNPSFVSYSSQAYFNFYNRIQKIQSGPKFSSSVLTGLVPVINREEDGHLGAIGISFLSDELSPQDLIKEESFAFSFAYKLKIATDLSFGAGVSWQVLQRFFDTGNFTTGSQYVIGKGFDPTLAVNEDFKDVSGGYSSWNSGILLQKSYSDSGTRYFLGASVSNLNRPVYTSDTENGARLDYQYGVQFGYNWRIKNNLHLLTDGDFRFIGDDEWLNFGVNMNYSWKKANSTLFGEGSVSLIPRYVVDRMYSFALEFSQPYYSIRFGRTINASKINTSYMSGNEIMLSLHKTFGRKSRKSLAKRIKRTSKLLRKKKEEFIWKDVYWDFTTVDQHAIIDPGLKKFADSMVEYMNRYKKSIVHIYVYTDLLANNAKNLEVSVHRAEVLSNYFEEQGIERSRIDYFGKGNANPLVPNAVGQERLKNRRIKFVIYR